MWVYELDWAGPGQRQMAEACECGNEPSGSVKCGEFLDQLQTSQLLKKDSAPWSKYEYMPVPVAARSKVQVYGRSPGGIVGANPTGSWISVCCECCVLSGRGICDTLITRPEESYRLWCVFVCDLETS